MDERKYWLDKTVPKSILKMVPKIPVQKTIAIGMNPTTGLEKKVALTRLIPVQ
jgi:hypothetical protein